MWVVSLGSTWKTRSSRIGRPSGSGSRLQRTSARRNSPSSPSLGSAVPAIAAAYRRRGQGDRPHAADARLAIEQLQVAETIEVVDARLRVATHARPHAGQRIEAERHQVAVFRQRPGALVVALRPAFRRLGKADLGRQPRRATRNGPRPRSHRDRRGPDRAATSEPPTLAWCAPATNTIRFVPGMARGWNTR